MGAEAAPFGAGVVSGGMVQSEVGERRHPWSRLNWPAIALIRGYKAVLSPFLGSHCRFHPTCSTYAMEAYERHHGLRATWLTVWRLLRCHPLGGRGIDPVPEYRGGNGCAGCRGGDDGPIE